MRPYLWAMGADAAADAVFYVVLAWAAVHSSGALSAALILGVGTVPRAVLMLVGGALGDRYGLMLTATRTLTVRVAVMAFFALALMSSGIAKVWLLAFISLVFGLIDAIHMPSMQAVSGLLIRDEKGQTKLTSAVGGIAQAAELILAPVAGFLIARNESAAGWACVVFLVVAVVGMRRVKKVAAEKGISDRAAEHVGEEPLWRSIRTGFGFVRGRPSIAFVLVVFCLSNLVATAPLLVGIPLKAKEQGWSGSEFGLATVGLALGFVIGSIGVIAKFADHLARRPIQPALACIGIGSIAALGLAVSETVPLVVVSCVVMGLMFGPAGQLLIASVKIQTPPELLGRVMSMVNFGIYAGIPLGYGLYGLLATGLEATGASLVFGSLLLVSSVIGLAFRRLRQSPVPPAVQ